MKGKVSVVLSKAEALVLFDWIKRFNDFQDGPFEDQAEQRVLWDLEASLEKQLAEPLAGNYPQMLAAARDDVRDAE